MKEFLMFYGIAALVIGGFVAAMDEVSFSIGGRPAPFQRLFAGLVAGAIWPVVVVKMVAGR